jgi:hypothetical protein
LWEVEDIPDGDRLFLRVHANDVRASGGKLHPGVFREQRGSMSVDWEKYSTAEESRNRARHPERVGILALIAGYVRSIEGLTVLHEPDEERRNRAHSGVHGIFDPNCLHSLTNGCWSLRFKSFLRSFYSGKNSSGPLQHPFQREPWKRLFGF